MVNESIVRRRSVVKALVVGVFADGLARLSPAAAPEIMDVKDPLARSVGYVEDSAHVDIKKYPSYVKGSNCENCLQLQGSAGQKFRPCTIFKGRLVASNGWCTAWTPEM